MKGWYSLIQYCHDPSRAEVANVGVALLCPEMGFFDARISNGNDRVRKFFQIEGEELERVSRLKVQFYQRLLTERRRLAKIEEFEQFRTSRGNQFLLSRPGTVRVADPEDRLNELFAKLVGGRHLGEKVERQRKTKSVRSDLVKLFERSELRDIVRPAQPVDSSIGRIKFHPDYEYRNGRMNFIKAVKVSIGTELVEMDAREVLAADLIRRKEGAHVIFALPDRSQDIATSWDEWMKLIQEYRLEATKPAEFDDLAKRILEEVKHS